MPGSSLAVMTLVALASAGDAGRYWDPQGSVVVGASGGALFSDSFNYGTIGVSAGYAVWTGVVPGLRGNVFFGDLTGGELATTLTLTPPLAWPLVPFGILEWGHAWQDASSFSREGFLYGVGGGVHIGRPIEKFTFRAGLIYRYYDFSPGESTFSPIVSATFRFGG